MRSPLAAFLQPWTVTVLLLFRWGEPWSLEEPCRPTSQVPSPTVAPHLPPFLPVAPPLCSPPPLSCLFPTLSFTSCHPFPWHICFSFLPYLLFFLLFRSFPSCILVFFDLPFFFSNSLSSTPCDHSHLTSPCLAPPLLSLKQTVCSQVSAESDQALQVRSCSC